MDLAGLLLPLGATDIERFEVEPLGLFGYFFDVPFSAQADAALGIGQFPLHHHFHLADHFLEQFGNLNVVMAFGLFEFLFKGLALLFAKAQPAGEPVGTNNDSFHATGYFERFVFDVFARPAEDRVK